jgi:4-hydroxybenzoate polyprenyltransferase
MAAGNDLLFKDPIFTFFYILGIVYIIGALLAGLYITYDWWKEKKNQRGGEE